MDLFEFLKENKTNQDITIDQENIKLIIKKFDKIGYGYLLYRDLITAFTPKFL